MALVASLALLSKAGIYLFLAIYPYQTDDYIKEKLEEGDHVMPSLRFLMFVVMDILPIYLFTLSIDPIDFHRTLVHNPEN